MVSDADLMPLVQRFAKMRALAARAIAESPRDTRALFGAGMASRITGDYATARNAYARAVELEPENPNFLFELAVVQEYLGNFDAAAETYARVLKAAPAAYKARQGLIQLQKQSVANNSIAVLEREFTGPDEDGWRTLHIGHALAKTYEDMGDHPASFAWLDRAKARRAQLHPYDDAREAALADAALASVENLPPTTGFDSSEPIFVAGMPRTGTTLVDRIISSHPQVSSAGEIGNFLQLFQRMNQTGPTPPGLGHVLFSRTGSTDMAQLGRLYIDSTRPLTGATPHFVDKAPSNYLQAGIILRALPNARVICLRRHALDSCLSNYKQIFPIDDRYYDYVYTLEGTARKFVHYDRVMRHWGKTLPPERYLEVSYDELVANQEAVTRRIIGFCGLPWDDRCLDFHKNAAGVATPSAKQVRSAMYATSMGRWAKYGALLDPARRVLEQAGIAID